MPISFRAVGVQLLTAGATSTTIVLPAGTAEGDLLIAWVELGNIVSAFNNPAGWNQFSWSPVVDGINSNAFVFWKFAAAGESNPSISWTTNSKGVILCAGYTGVDIANPLGNNNVNIETTSQTTATTPTLTAVDGEWSVTFHSSRTSTTANKSPTWTAPSGETSRQQSDNGAAASAPWSAVACFDSNGLVTTGSHSYTATSNFTESHHKSALIYINVAAPPPQQTPRRNRIVVPARRPTLARAVPLTDQQAPPAQVNDQPRRVRGLMERRGRNTAPVPTTSTPQVNPGYPWAVNDQARRLRGMLPRRSHYIVPVRPQVNPPFPWRTLVQPRRLRGVLARHGRLWAPTLAQDPPIAVSDQPRRLRGLLPRRGHQAQVIPPQFNPPFPVVEIVQKRRLRGLPVRRGHQWWPTPAQQAAPTNPAFPWADITQPRRVRGLLARHGRNITPVPPQVNPPFPWRVVSQVRRVRGLLPRHVDRPVPTPAQDAPVTAVTPRRPRLAVVRRIRPATPVAAQATPATVSPARRPRPAPARRGHAVTPVPTTTAIVPAFPWQVLAAHRWPRALRRLFGRLWPAFPLGQAVAPNLADFRFGPPGTPWAFAEPGTGWQWSTPGPSWFAAEPQQVWTLGQPVAATYLGGP